MKPNTAANVHGSLPAVLYRIAAMAALAGAGYFVLVFIYIAVSRIGYPFALEWLEGGSYAQVQRVLAGQPLYARPSMEYVAMIYPPLYYYAAAILSRLVGFSFTPLRLVSLASSLGAMLAIFLIVQRESGHGLAALLASGLFAATYQHSGSWFDIARVDMLAVFLLLLAIWLLRRDNEWSHLAAGVVFAAACLTKQIHLITLVCLMAYFAVADRKKVLTFALPCLITLAAASLLLDGLYRGWFSFFALRLALGSGEYVTFDPGAFVHTAREFWLDSVLLALPIVAMLILLFLVISVRRLQAQSSLLFYLVCAVGMIGTSWSVVQVGGYRNDLIPAYAIIAILSGLALGGLLMRAANKPLQGFAILAAVVIQFLLFRYPISPELPTPADLAAGRDILNQIREQSGEVYVPFHPELPLMAGKQPFASWSPMYQLEGNYGGGDVRLAGRVKTEFVHAMQRHQFSMIILDQEPNWIWGDPEKSYVRRSQPAFADPDAFWPVTGWQTRPEFVWLPPAE